MDTPRWLGCGCCTSGCICEAHSGWRNAFKPIVCEHHRLLDDLNELRALYAQNVVREDYQP